MNEKKWTDDERDEAFDRGMETMQRVALELYRRGREPLLAELEDCRARNADLRTMLEQVTRDRDHVEESLVRLETQRDEARAEAERYLADLRRCASEPYEHAKERAEAFRSGAEAMREACAQCFREHDESFELTVDACHDVIADMPIPEEP